MPYRADLELARVHLSQMEQKIKGQKARIAALAANGRQTTSAQDLLAVLSQSCELLRDYIQRTERTEPPGTPFLWSREGTAPAY